MSESVKQLLEGQQAYTDQLLRYFGQDDASRYVVSIDDCTDLYWFFDGDVVYSDQHMDSLHERNMHLNIDRLSDGQLRIYKRGKFTLAKTDTSFCIWDNAKEIQMDGSVLVPTSQCSTGDTDYFTRKEEREKAAELLSNKNWIPEETQYAHDSTRFDIRVSEYVGRTVVVPRGWSIVLFSPKDK